MSIRGFSPIVGLQAKAKPSLIQKPPKSVRTHSEKKFTPQINKSFTCYNHAPNQSNQSFTAEKCRNISLAHLKSRNTSAAKYRNFRLDSKIFQQRSPQIRTHNNVPRKGPLDMKFYNFKSAISYLNKVIKEEPNNPDALYSRGKCYISMTSYKEAIPDLLV